MIHDWGYWGLSDMDGEEGERHPIWAAELAWQYLDRPYQKYSKKEMKTKNFWYYTDLCRYHSRFYAKKHDCEPSKLCWADKKGSALMPTWLWVFLGSLTGEIAEYMNCKKYEIYGQSKVSLYQWFEDYKVIIKKLLKEQGFHAD